MDAPVTLFLSVFTTLLAIINPLEALPIFLKLLDGTDDATHGRVALRSCFYAMLLMFFFLLFGTLILRVFDVPLSMVRIVGGIVLMRIGFELFSGSSGSGSMISAPSGGKPEDVAFVPLAMPIMFGPGAIATIIGMTSTIKELPQEVASFIAVSAAIALTMAVTYLCLASAEKAAQPPRSERHRRRHPADRLLRRDHGHGADLPRTDRGVPLLRTDGPALRPSSRAQVPKYRCLLRPSPIDRAGPRRRRDTMMGNFLTTRASKPAIDLDPLIPSRASNSRSRTLP